MHLQETPTKVCALFSKTVPRSCAWLCSSVMSTKSFWTALNFCTWLVVNQQQRGLVWRPPSEGHESCLPPWFCGQGNKPREEKAGLRLEQVPLLLGTDRWGWTPAPWAPGLGWADRIAVLQPALQATWCPRRCSVPDRVNAGAPVNPWSSGLPIRPRSQEMLMKPSLQLMSQQQQAKYPVEGKAHGYCQLSFQLTAFVFVLWVVLSPP